MGDQKVSDKLQKDHQRHDRRLSLTKIDNDCPALCMFRAKHNDDQTEEHICHNHDNASLLEAANILHTLKKNIKQKLNKILNLKRVVKY